MTLKNIIKTTDGLLLLVWLVIGQMLFLGKSVRAGDNGQLPEFNTSWVGHPMAVKPAVQMVFNQ